MTVESSPLNPSPPVESPPLDPVKIEAYGEVRQAPGTVQFIVTVPNTHTEAELAKVYDAVHNAVTALKGSLGVVTLFETKFWTETSTLEATRSGQPENDGGEAEGD